MSALVLPILACNRHLLIDLPIFMGPVVLLAGWLLVMTRRARSGERTGGELEIGKDLFEVHT